ncbi:MAG: L,D-transpeptidase family protein [Vicinamibacterales bacterium]
MGGRLPILLLAAVVMAAPSVGAQTHSTRRHHAVAKKRSARVRRPVDVNTVAIQVMLDRAGYSPGEIDGQMGTATKRALDAYENNGGNPNALPPDALAKYQITAQDAAGPFAPQIPPELMQQAKLDALDYQDLPEELGERFHASPTLLHRLNPGIAFAANATITVPNVGTTPAPVGPPPGRQTDSGNPADTTVTVRKSTSDLVVTDAEGRTLFYAPVTTGSQHDPLPLGTWKVKGVQHNPAFHYNPKEFWDAKPGDAKATIAPGPNNPVGVVWIDLNKPDYGIHGTPEPSLIGKTTSHGCVRMTNWDALTVASLVRPGTRVVFSQ